MRSRISLLVALALMLGVATVSGCSSTQSAGTPSASSTTASTESTAPASARSEYFVSIAELSAKAGAGQLVDARDQKAYDAGHIKGAVDAPWQTFASVTKGKSGDADWGTLLTPAEIGKALDGLGIDLKKPIVVYGDPTGWGEDGRVVWTLKAVGATDVRMLDGGFPAWAAAGNTASKEAAKPVAVTNTMPATLDASLNITTAQIKAGLGTLKIVDVRAKKEYDGATDFGEARGGHLPGAVNMQYIDVFNANGTVKTDAELQTMFDKAGLTDKNAEVAFYCTKGIRSAYVSLLAQMLGYTNAKNYDASYYSWAGDQTLSVEK